MQEAGYIALGIVVLLFMAYVGFVAIVYGCTFVYSMLVSWGIIPVKVPVIEDPMPDAWPPAPKNESLKSGGVGRQNG